MSMLRLLAAGRSLMGGDDRTNRYRLPRRHPLPSFGGEANPFASTVLPSGERAAAQAVHTPAVEAVAVAQMGSEAGQPALPPRGWLAWLNPFRRPPAAVQAPSISPAGQAVSPHRQPVQPLAQPELSLLAVQVVRNDLSEAEEAPPRARLKGKALLGRAFPRVAEPRCSLEDELPAERMLAEAGTGAAARRS